MGPSNDIQPVEVKIRKEFPESWIWEVFDQNGLDIILQLIYYLVLSRLALVISDIPYFSNPLPLIALLFKIYAETN